MSTNNQGKTTTSAINTSKTTSTAPQPSDTSSNTQLASSNVSTNPNVQSQLAKKTNNVNPIGTTMSGNVVIGTGSSSQLPVNQTQTNPPQTQPLQTSKNSKQTKSQTEEQKDFEERQQALEESTTNLIINYIPPELNEGALATLFSSYGTMQNIKIVVEPYTGRSRGYGFVKYESPESARRAQKELNGYSVGGKKLKVAYSRPQSKEIQNANLYVTNVPTDWDNTRLAQVFKPYGFVVESRILLDEEGRSRKVGFVRMDNHNNAIKAINALHDYEVGEGVELVVKLAQRKNQNRRFGNNPGGGDGGDNRTFGHRNYAGRKSGGGFPEQGGGRVSDTQMSGGYHKGGPSNRRHVYRQRPDSFSDFAPNTTDPNIYPASYDPYAQYMPKYYDPQSVNPNPPTGGVSLSTSSRPYAGQSYTIVVQNLPENYNVDHLIKLYAPYGPIQSVHIQKPNQHSDQPQPSYGIVSYFYADHAKLAIEQTHGKKESGCVLHVTWQ